MLYESILPKKFEDHQIFRWFDPPVNSHKNVILSSGVVISMNNKDLTLHYVSG